MKKNKSVTFRYNFGKHTYDENLQYITNLPELERQRVDKWISDMNKSAQKSNNKYKEFDEARFRPIIGINFVRSSIQDMWVKVNDTLILTGTCLYRVSI